MLVLHSHVTRSPQLDLLGKPHLFAAGKQVLA